MSNTPWFPFHSFAVLYQRDASLFHLLPCPFFASRLLCTLPSSSACSFKYFSLSVSRFLTARSFRSLALCSRNRTMLYSSLSRRRRSLACFSFQSWSSSRRCLRRSWCIRSNLSFLIHWRNMLNSRRVHFIKPLFVMKPSGQTKKRFKVSKQWLTIIKFPAPNIKFLVFWLVYSFPVVSSYFDSPHTGMHCTNCCGAEKAPNIQTFRI